MKHKSLLLMGGIVLPLLCVSCKNRDGVDVTVSNPTSDQLGTRCIELPAGPILKKLGSEAFYITDNNGNEIPSQLTYNSMILFDAEVPAGESKKYTVHPSDTLHTYPATVYGDFYPKRRDDIAFENELVGFRLYGPGTQRAGERAYGYDIFFKHPTDDLIVPQLYALETDDATWAKVDSLRKISPKMADEFVDSFSYHIDHGLGMDCYAVGPTLGAGAGAILANDTIRFPWCYETADILDNGPLRFTLALNFAPTEIDGDREVREHRIISLDSKNHLNSCKVWYDGISKPMTVVTGFPLRDESEVINDSEAGIIAYADPTQGPDNGKALLGIVMDSKGAASIDRKEGHTLLATPLNPSDTLSYRWGFAWDRADIASLKEWKDYLDKARLSYTVTID